jgi:hypothetical protein
MAYKKAFLRDRSRFAQIQFWVAAGFFKGQPWLLNGAPGSMPGGVSSMRNLLFDVDVYRAGCRRPSPALAEEFRLPDGDAAAE